jgi:hypothetical protein
MNYLGDNLFVIKCDDGVTKSITRTELALLRDEDLVVPKRFRRGNIKSPIPSRCRIQETRKQILAISHTLFAHTTGPSFFDIDVKDVLTLMISRMGLREFSRENNQKINISSSWDGTNLGNMAFFMWGLKLVDTRSTDFHTGKPSVLGETVQSRNNCLPCGIAFKKDLPENVQRFMAKFTKGYYLCKNIFKFLLLVFFLLLII